jgi:hypothetical protein
MRSYGAFTKAFAYANEITLLILWDAIDRKGSWFKAARRFRCQQRQTDTRMGHHDKLRLFSKYGGAEKSQGGAAPNGEAGMEQEASSADGVTKQATPAARAPTVLDGEADGKTERGNGPDDKPITREDLDFVPVQHFG